YITSAAPTPSTPGACSADEWQCDNGKCINAEFKCDGLLDCIDNSDETEKNCPLESVGSENVSENLPFLPEVQATNTSSHSPVVWNELHKTAHLACTNYSNLPMQIPQRTEFTPRIYGGVIAKRGEFPWMAALGYININPGGITYDCGGTIISAYFVLTAGHCATPNRSPILVKLGKIDLTDDIDTTNYEIQKIVRHPDYSRLKNDIALIRVKNSISFTTEIRPVCLHMPEYDINFEEDLTLPGWGKTESNKKSNYLLKTKLKMMPLSECNETIKLYWREGINERHYCAYDPLGKNDACEGDSGGPLQYFNSDSNITTVVGIVSSGNGCGGLGIYTRVAYYLGWIESIVWPHNEQQSN
ncbi:serine protease persephone-like, partial [Contarinia nasturtii]|uniref:serine protease persephone-like n=1 Tax=Contarinia nasturtii TaxID=265458 RepID=UPI0012D3B54D